MSSIPATLQWKNKCYPPLCRSLLVSWQYQSLSFVIGRKGPINEQKWLCVEEIRRKVLTGAQYEAFHRVCSSHQGSAQRPNHSWIAFDLIVGGPPWTISEQFHLSLSPWKICFTLPVAFKHKAGHIEGDDHWVEVARLLPALKIQRKLDWEIAKKNHDSTSS